MKRCLRKMISMVIVFSIMLSIFSVNSIGHVKSEGYDIVPINELLDENELLDDSESSENNETVDFVIENGKLIEYYGDDVDVIIPDTVTVIGEYVFSWKSIKSIVISNSVTTIEREAFAGCNNLTNVMIPNSVTAIDSTAFKYCRKLESFAIESSESIYSIYDGCLYNQDQTELILYPNGKASFELSPTVSNIDESIFQYNTLNSISISSDNGFYSVYDNCLYNKNQTELLVLPNGKKDLKIPASLTKFNILVWEGLRNMKTISIDKSNAKYSSYDNCIYNKNGTELLLSINTKKSLTLNKNIKKATYAAISGCYYVTTVKIPSNVTDISKIYLSGFWNLKTITLPNKLTSIGKEVFYPCWNLKTITIPKSVKNIHKKAFNKDKITLKVYKNSYAEDFAKKNKYKYKIIK